MRIATVKEAYKCGKEHMLKEALKWLNENVWPMTGVDYSALTESFLKAMKKDIESET